MKERAKGQQCRYRKGGSKIKCGKPTKYHHLFCPKHHKIMREEAQKLTKKWKKNKEDKKMMRKNEKDDDCQKRYTNIPLK